MTSKALAFETAGNKRYTELHTGDKVLATLRNGSQFVACRVHSFNDTHVFFLWGQVVFSVEIELAAMSTVLIERFNRADVIAEIMAFASKVA